MRGRGSDRPDGNETGREASGRRWGRGKGQESPQEPVSPEEFGWIDDLRTAKQARTELGPADLPPPATRPEGPRAQPPTPPAPGEPTRAGGRRRAPEEPSAPVPPPPGNAAPGNAPPGNAVPPRGNAVPPPPGKAAPPAGTGRERRPEPGRDRTGAHPQPPPARRASPVPPRSRGADPAPEPPGPAPHASGRAPGGPGTGTPPARPPRPAPPPPAAPTGAGQGERQPRAAASVPPGHQSGPRPPLAPGAGAHPAPAAGGRHGLPADDVPQVRRGRTAGAESTAGHAAVTPRPAAARPPVGADRPGAVGPVSGVARPGAVPAAGPTRPDVQQSPRGAGPVDRSPADPGERPAGRAVPPGRPGAAVPPRHGAAAEGAGAAGERAPRERTVPPAPGAPREPVPPSVARAAAVVPPAPPAEGPGRVRPAPGDAPQPADAPQSVESSAGGTLRAARSELRRQMRERRRLRLAVLAVVSLVVLGAIPLYYGIRAAGRDPVFDSLDELDVPGWAATKTVDDVSGNRWCLLECRLRERTVQSQRPPEETARVYERALSDAGWRRWKVSRCPEQPVKGRYTCWRRDELTLDLWVRDPICATAPESPAPPTPGVGPDAGRCEGSLISVKVRNAIDDERTGPQPSTRPTPPADDPLPIITEDPLQDVSPTPS